MLCSIPTMSFSTLFGKLGTNVAISVYPQGNTSGKKYYTGNAVLAGLGNDMPADDLSGISDLAEGQRCAD
jgi:hypothetical protein